MDIACYSLNETNVLKEILQRHATAQTFESTVSQRSIREPYSFEHNATQYIGTPCLVAGVVWNGCQLTFTYVFVGVRWLFCVYMDNLYVSDWSIT